MALHYRGRTVATEGGYLMQVASKLIVALFGSRRRHYDDGDDDEEEDNLSETDDSFLLIGRQ